MIVRISKPEQMGPEELNELLKHLPQLNARLENQERQLEYQKRIRTIGSRQNDPTMLRFTACYKETQICPSTK